MSVHVADTAGVSTGGRGRRSRRLAVAAPPARVLVEQTEFVRAKVTQFIRDARLPATPQQ
jgi:hypothetical protein